MDEERILRDEAKTFAQRNLRVGVSKQPIETFSKIKNRLYDFYSSEYKSIFLDEIKTFLVLDLKTHRDSAHGGEADPNCGYENQVEKLLFYIEQEIGTLPVIAHQRNTTKDQNSRYKVFISYSHLDNEFLHDVKRHFKPFLQKIDFWDDTKIQPGQKWKEEIRKAINSTKVAILLVSTDFLGSDFIATDELPPLLEAAEENGAVILIVIIKPCLFEEFSDLNQFQAMNPPNKPVSKMDINEREELYVNLVRQTKKILEETEYDENNKL